MLLLYTRMRMGKIYSAESLEREFRNYWKVENTSGSERKSERESKRGIGKSFKSIFNRLVVHVYML